MLEGVEPQDRQGRRFRMTENAENGTFLVQLVALADGSSEGAISPDGRVIGTYIHGLFVDDQQRSAWLTRFAAGRTTIRYDALIDETLDRLAAHLAAHIDLDLLLKLSR